MLNSLRLYAKYFIVSAISPAGKYLWLDTGRYIFNKDIFKKEPHKEPDLQAKALMKAIAWLVRSQQANTDGGMGSFHLINKWSSSYPETTGYIIPTLLNFGRKYDNDEVTGSAMKAAKFLLKIQKKSGGWQGGRVAENKPEIVFNTGQAIRGMMAAYNFSGEQKYLDAASAAGRWLSGIQNPEGYWKEFALMNQPRVYDTFVDAPLLELYGLTGEESLKNAAIRNLDWVVGEKMLENGWFEDCDNTIRRNDKPILHTIAYTLDGLVDCGLMLADEKYIAAARKGAAQLREIFPERGYLHGRYDRNWHGSEHMICTGSAQISIVWLKFFRISGERVWYDAAGQMLDLLMTVQSRMRGEPVDTLGAIPGSFPLWGRYEPFAFPNWATKFFADALLLESELRP